MGVYIVGFVASTLLLASSNRVVKKQRWFPIMLALLIPCVIAGLRDSTIGTDVHVYLVQMTESAISASNFREYLNSTWYGTWRYLQVSDYEIGFTLVVYGIAKIFRNIYAVQFFLQVLVVVPIYVATSKFETERKWNWLCLLTYYLMLYNTTLNMMRQSIAMAFILLAFSFYVNNDKKKCAFFFVVAFMFHTSALLGGIILLLYRFVSSDQKKSFLLVGRKRISGHYANMIFAVILGIMCVVGVQFIITLLNWMGLSKYVGYISGNLSFMPNQIISRLPLLLLVVYAWKKGGEDVDFRFYFTMICFDVLLSQFTSVNSFAGRIGMYFSQFEILFNPNICIATKKSKIVMFLLISYLAFYWWFYYAFGGASETVPYKFGF